MRAAPAAPIVTAPPAVGHGAVALLGAAALYAARRALNTASASPEDRLAAARTLIARGGPGDRQTGAAILAASAAARTATGGAR